MKVKIPSSSDLDDVFDAIKAEGVQGLSSVQEYLGECPVAKVIFYGLQPPPRMNAFKISNPTNTVTNLSAVLEGVEKATLSNLLFVTDLFGGQPDRKLIYLYIEKISGNFLSIWLTSWLNSCVCRHPGRDRAPPERALQQPLPLPPHRNHRHLERGRHREERCQLCVIHGRRSRRSTRFVEEVGEAAAIQGTRNG